VSPAPALAFSSNRLNKRESTKTPDATRKTAWPKAPVTGKKPVKAHRAAIRATMSEIPARFSMQGISAVGV